MNFIPIIMRIIIGMNFIPIIMRIMEHITLYYEV